MAEKINVAAAMAPALDPSELPAGTRTIEAITGEILQLKQEAGNAILGIGQRLIEAKNMLSHGEWLPWLTEQVEFSERTAQNFMRLSREWSNPQALADLGSAKALTLLALPAEERERFISEAHMVNGEEKTVVDMTSRELERAIRECEAAKAEQKVAEESRDKMAEDLALAKNLLQAAQNEKAHADQCMAALEKELADLKAAPVEVAIASIDQKALDQAKAEAISEMQAKLDKAKNAKDKAEEKRKEAESTIENLKAQIEALQKAEKKAIISSDKDMATFEVLFNQAQELVNKMQGILIKLQGRDDDSAAKTVAKAMKALSEAIGRAAE